MREPQQAQNRKWRWFKPTGTVKAETNDNNNDDKTKEKETIESTIKTEGVGQISGDSSNKDLLSRGNYENNLSENDSTSGLNGCSDADVKKDNLISDFENMNIASVNEDCVSEGLKSNGVEEDDNFEEDLSCTLCLAEQVHLCNKDVEKEVKANIKVDGPNNEEGNEGESEDSTKSFEDQPKAYNEVQGSETEVTDHSTEVAENVETSPPQVESNISMIPKEVEKERISGDKLDKQTSEVNKVVKDSLLVKVDPKERLEKYLAFMKLWNELYPEEGAKKEGNLVWKTKIEQGDLLSLPDYYEQVATLRSTLKFLSYGDSLPDCEGAEFTCLGAEESVQVAGSFSDWAPVSLEKRGAEEWGVTMDLGPGRYSYKYLVDGEWIIDPSKEVEIDDKGNENNVVVVEDRITATLRQISEQRASMTPKLYEHWQCLYPGLGLCPK